MSLLFVPCPKCSFPRLQATAGRYEYQYAGELVCVPDIEFCICPHCGQQSELADQHERNRQRITDANLDALASKWAVTRPVVFPPGGHPLPPDGIERRRGWPGASAAGAGAG